MLSSPDLPILPYSIHNGVKYFELVAQPVQREILPNLYINCWGYNGTMPGPTIVVFPGDFVQIRVFNRLPEDTSVHWHGLDIPNNMDGVPEIEPSPKIKPGQYFDYQFRITNQPGTHMYHTHVDTARQEMLGLAGGFIILDPMDNEFAQDYFILLQEFKVKDLPKGKIYPGIYDIDPLAMDFNFFTMNGRCFPYTTPLAVGYGDITRVRLANSSDQAHPIHIHGHQFIVSASDGNMIPFDRRIVKNTILVSSGETWDVQFIANNPGIWPFHCHIPHHMANNFTKDIGGMLTTITYKR